MNGRDKRRLGFVIIAVIIAVTVLTALANRAPTPEFSVTAASQENLSSIIISNGKVEPISPEVLRAQFPTFVEKVVAVEGQNVRAGQLLLTLDATEIRADLARHKEALLNAEEDLRAAKAGGHADELAQLDSDIRKNEIERARLRKEGEGLERLVAKQAATRDELEQNKLSAARTEADAQRLLEKKAEIGRRSRLDLDRATLAVERARNDVRALEEKAHSAEVTAPVDGTLYSLPMRAGNYVKVGDALAEMANLKQVRVRAFVDEPELGWIELNQNVEITWDAAPGHGWMGKTSQIPKTVVNRGSRSVGEVLCSVANEKLELLPNINVNVRINARESTSALVVPRGAVHGEGANRFVFVLEGITLHKRNVTLGIAGLNKYEILSGLKAGERVALPGEIEPRDDLRVSATERK